MSQEAALERAEQIDAELERLAMQPVSVEWRIPEP
jgi:hypothetical protein